MEREAKRALGFVAYELWTSCLVGNQAPSTEARYERMRHPRPGDLVMEVSTIGWLLRHDPDLMDDRWDGQLVPYVRTEWEPRGDDVQDVIVCLNPDGTEFRWTNADIVAVPSSPIWHHEVEDRAAAIVASR